MRPGTCVWDEDLPHTRSRVPGHVQDECEGRPGVDGPVADFFIGHNIDDEGYDKTPWTSPEHFRNQDSEGRGPDCNEERVSHSMEKKIQEGELKVKNQTQVDKDLAEMREQQKDYAFLKQSTWLKFGLHGEAEKN